MPTETNSSRQTSTVSRISALPNTSRHKWITALLGSLNLLPAKLIWDVFTMWHNRGDNSYITRHSSMILSDDVDLQVKELPNQLTAGWETRFHLGMRPIRDHNQCLYFCSSVCIQCAPQIFCSGLKQIFMFLPDIFLNHIPSPRITKVVTFRKERQ